MTAMILKCPTCSCNERLEFKSEDTFMALGKETGPNEYQMLDESEMSAFDAARIGWSLLEKANEKLEALASEYDRVIGQLDMLSTAMPNLGPFVASASRTLFHRPECKWSEYFLDGRSCVVFETHEDAVASGRRPCRTCCA